MCLSYWKQTIIPLPHLLYIYSCSYLRLLGQMGRYSNDPIATHSSIALLQERFRQLQRVKEMREERELLMKNLGDHGKFSPVINYQPSKFSSHPDQFIFQSGTPSPPEVTLSLWPKNLQIGHSKFQNDDKPLLRNSKRRDELFTRASSNKFHESDSGSDVDTSLHL